MNILLDILFILVLLMIYSILFYRIFVKRTNKWVKENVGLTVITMLITLTSDYVIQIKSLIFMLSSGFLIILLYRKIKTKKDTEN